MTYEPKPIDTSSIELTEGDLQLVESLAENTHDVWAQGRIAEGWTYGESRDDDAKKHPCLVPYADLSESEKQYDRNTAIESVKLFKMLRGA